LGRTASVLLVFTQASLGHLDLLFEVKGHSLFLLSGSRGCAAQRGLTQEGRLRYVPSLFFRLSCRKQEKVRLLHFSTEAGRAFLTD